MKPLCYYVRLTAVTFLSTVHKCDFSRFIKDYKTTVFYKEQNVVYRSSSLECHQPKSPLMMIICITSFLSCSIYCYYKIVKAWYYTTCTLIYFLYIVVYCRHFGFLVHQFQAYHLCLAVRKSEILQSVP